MALVVASGCTTAPPPPAVCSAPQGAPADALALATSDAAFAVALFQPAVAAAGAGKNVLVSPYSVSATLTMVDVGAAGATDSQIQSVLRLPGSGTAVAPAYAALACQDETDGTADGDQLSIANSIWGQKGMAFQPSFLSTLSTGYDAPLQQVDFGSDPDGAASTINAWVSAQTHDQIADLLQPGNLDSLTRLVLVNAVYFKGAWATAFDASATAPQPFTLGDGTSVSIPTMHSATVSLRSGSAQGASIHELSYKGNGLAMDFIVPDGSLPALEASLTPASLSATVSSLQGAATVELYLPKFSFRTASTLVPILEGMGIVDLFDAKKANLSGMDGAMDLYVKTVIQDAIVEVDETGTVAAAATEATSEATSAVAVPPTVRIDHPFLFLIRDTTNGSILFMGQVQDPRQG